MTEVWAMNPNQLNQFRSESTDRRVTDSMTHHTPQDTQEPGIASMLHIESTIHLLDRIRQATVIVVYGHQSNSCAREVDQKEDDSSRSFTGK